MPLRRVDRAISKPNHCAVFPQLGQSHDRGYFDTGNELAGFDNHIYVSVVAVEEMAKQLGYVSPEDHEARCVEVEELRLALDQVLADAAETARQFEAIDVIESAGFRARKKAGRPPAKPQTEKAAA